MKLESNTIDKDLNKIKYNKHPKRKNNIVVAAMYAMYQSPKSIAEVAKVYRKTRQTVYDTFKSRGYKLRSKELKGLTMYDGHRFTLTKGGYLRGTIKGKRQLLHWYVWEKYNGYIPPGFVIHHKDNNPANNEIENLELVARSDMGKRFNPSGNNQHIKK